MIIVRVQIVQIVNARGDIAMIKFEKLPDERDGDDTWTGGSILINYWGCVGMLLFGLLVIGLIALAIVS